MARVTAPVGRCGLWGLEAVAWTGQGVRLCETCYQRESRRTIGAGKGVVAATDTVLADDPAKGALPIDAVVPLGIATAGVIKN